MTHDDLPVDPDVDPGDGRSPRPLHLRAPYLVLVAIGGAVGTATREGLALAFPGGGAFPVVVFLINLSGAFVLGLLLEALLRLGPDEGMRQRLRLLLGTGFCGGYTTYSTFAVGTAHLLSHDHVALGIGYGLGTVLLGAVATIAGILLGARTTRGRAAS